MSFDLSPLLKGWDFVQGQVSVRQIEGVDGQQKLQLRLDLGLLQMELDGRPDGQRPMGYESLFHSYQALATVFEEQHAGEPNYVFRLDAEDCAKLQQEAVQYYHRYLALFQMSDWDRVIRDTQRNIDLFDFVQEHVENQNLAMMFQQFRPYVLMMRSRARAQKALNHHNHDGAIEEVKKGINEIRTFFQQNLPPDTLEHNHEIRFLENWRQELEKHRPVSERDKIQKALSEAIEREDYEAAALLRDNLRQLSS